MELDTAMEFSIWKEEPLSPVYSVLEDQTDVWELFKDDVAKQSQTPERDPLGGLENHADWLPDSPDDSCDSLADNSPQALIARAQLASQLLQDLDEVLIKEEYSSSDWYEPKTGLSMFDELPSPTPAFFKDEALAGAAPAPRPFAGLSLTTAHFAPSAANTFAASAFATPAPPAAVPVALTAVQQQQQQQQSPAESLQPLQHSTAASLPLTLTDTQTLLQEFESVFGKVEQSHGGALTPPQSPPHHTQHLFIATAPATATSFVYHHQQQQQQQQQQQHHHQQQAAFDTGLLTTVHHQDQEQLIAEVDEIVRSRVHAEESWPASPSAFAASFAPPSPCTSSNSSSNSSYSSDSPAPASPETDDPDWLPASSQDAAATTTTAPTAAAAPGPSRKRGQSKRSKPYGHTVEDKRIRKKEQNKNAATRYRMKKKAEVEVILGEENELKDKNDELTAKVADLSQEVRYLKNLMRDLFRARGLIK